MVAMPSGAVSRITSTGKWLFSSHSAACGAMRSLAKTSAVSWIAACSSVRAKCMDVIVGQVDWAPGQSEWAAEPPGATLTSGPFPMEIGLWRPEALEVAPRVKIVRICIKTDEVAQIIQAIAEDLACD